MESDRYVLDANVFLEYIYDRPLQDQSRKIVQDGIVGAVRIIVPSLLLDEVTEVLCGNLDDLKEVERHLLYIEKLVRNEVLGLVVPDTAVRMKAIEIARTGDAKSDYPEWTDALYHALAIINDAMFITNDLKYVRKMKEWGHIQPLAQYGLEN